MSAVRQLPAQLSRRGPNVNSSVIGLAVGGATAATIALLLGHAGALVVVAGATAGCLLLTWFGLGTHRGTSPEGGQWGPALAYTTIGAMVILMTVMVT